MAYCARCTTHYDDSKKFCKMCGTKLEIEISNEVQPSAYSPSAEAPAVQNLPQTEGDKPPLETGPSRGAHSDSVEGGRKNLLLVFSVAIPVLILCVVVYSMNGRSARRSTSNPTKIIVAAPESSPLRDTHSSEQSLEKEMTHVLNTLREANLSKNIDLFMSCYSPTFPSLKEKRSSTIASWQQSRYVTLKYEIKKAIFAKDQVSATVEWKMSAYVNKSAEPATSKANYYVVMQRENGKLGITSLRKI